MKVGMAVLSAVMMLSSTMSALAASTSVYVVTRCKSDGLNFPKQTITYNKTGLLKKITKKASSDNYPYEDNYVTSFYYKNNRISKKVEKSSDSKAISTPYYEGDKLNSLTYKRDDNGPYSNETYYYYYSGNNIIQYKTVDVIEDGRELTSMSSILQYKNGLLIKYLDRSYAYDSKGYLSYKDSFDLAGDGYDGAYLKNVYDSKGLLKAVYVKKYEHKKRKPSKKPFVKFTYKKIKVSRSVVKKVKAQQKWILRNIGDASIYNI